MSKILQCKQCAGTEFKKIGQYQYKCKYCGVITLLQPSVDQQFHDRQIKGDIQKKNKRTKYLVFFIVASSTISFFTSICLRKSPNEKKSYQNFSKPSTIVSTAVKVKKETKSAKLNFNIVQHRIVKNSSGSNVFLALLKNIGEARFTNIRIEIHFYLKKEKILVKSGYGVRQYLDPGEVSPIKIYLPKNLNYDDYKLIVHPKKAKYVLTRPKIKIGKLKFTKDKYSKFQVNGNFKNLEDKAIKLVQMKVALFDAKNNLYYIGTSYIQQQYIAKKEKVPFQFICYALKEKPEKYIVDYNAYFH